MCKVRKLEEKSPKEPGTDYQRYHDDEPLHNGNDD